LQSGGSASSVQLMKARFGSFAALSAITRGDNTTE